jgi:hypothetical protein
MADRPLFNKLTEQEMDGLFDHAAQMQTAAEQSENVYQATAYAMRSIASTNLIIAYMVRAEMVYKGDNK